MKIVDYFIKSIELFRNIIDPPETWCKHPECPWILLSSKGYWKLDTKNEEFWKGVKGGTNTAVQLAMKHNIPIYNFYLQEDIDKVKSMMEKYKV